MALQLTIQEKDNFGIVVSLENTYCKVSAVTGSKETATATAVFLSAQDGFLYKKEEYQFVPNMNGGNFIKQAYEHLKTLPEFAGAADV